MRRRNVIKDKGIDRGFLGLTLLLTVLGVVSIANVSAPQALEAYGDSYYFVKQQVSWGALGVVALLVASRIKYTFWKKVAPILFGASVLFLIMVLIPGLGNKFLGARRWIVIGPVNFQPSEVVKLGLALLMAWMAEEEWPTYYYVVPVAVVAVLIMLQPDLGTTIVVVGIAAVQMFVMGLNWIHLVGFGGAGVVLAGLAILLSDYRRARLMTFLRSSTDPLGSSYHIRQILIALGSGGFIGTGLGQSRQKFLFLPEVATDSVFAVIGEEIGFVGGAMLIILLTVYIMRAVRIATKAPDTFSMVLSSGIAAWIGGQCFMNLGSMVALVPLTGIPLPFFSYGGSSLMMILLGAGILLNISKYEKVERKKSWQR